MNKLDDVKDILSTSADSAGIVFVEFEGGCRRRQEVRRPQPRAGRRSATSCPGITRLEVKRINPGHTNIVQLALVSDTVSQGHVRWVISPTTCRTAWSACRAYANRRLRPPARELRAEADLKRMSSLNVRLGQLLERRQRPQHQHTRRRRWRRQPPLQRADQRQLRNPRGGARHRADRRRQPPGPHQRRRRRALGPWPRTSIPRASTATAPCSSRPTRRKARTFFVTRAAHRQGARGLPEARCRPRSS